MKNLDELLGGLPLSGGVPTAPPPPVALGCDPDLIHLLGAGLPAGHLHVWGGPTGAGKTSFLLSLLFGAAVRGRRVAYATYDLPARTLAARLLSMAASVDPARLADGQLTAAERDRAAAVRRTLTPLPVWFLESRGLSVRSLEDRLVRMPFRADVLAVDFLQAVVREPGTDLGHALRELSALATRLHLAVVCVLRSDDAGRAEGLEGVLGGVADRADRVGWIAPAAGSGCRRAEVLRNRYGERSAVPLHYDASTGALHREALHPDAVDAGVMDAGVMDVGAADGEAAVRPAPRHGGAGSA